MLGSISLKGTTKEARFGNPTPRIAECEAGLLNAVGLQNPGVHKVIEEELPKLRQVFHKKAIANISRLFGGGLRLHRAPCLTKKRTVGILEINISCPNVKHGGMAFGTDPEAAATVCRAVKEVTHKPVYMKLSPNVTDIVAIAKAVAQAGADGLVLINTLFGMRIEPRTGKPIVSTKMAGFSGPAIKPVALRMVYQVCQAVDLPVIGVGGDPGCGRCAGNFVRRRLCHPSGGARTWWTPGPAPRSLKTCPARWTNMESTTCKKS